MSTHTLHILPMYRLQLVGARMMPCARRSITNSADGRMDGWMDSYYFCCHRSCIRLSTRRMRRPSSFRFVWDWFGPGSLGGPPRPRPSWLADGDSGGRQTRPCERRALNAGIRLSASDTSWCRRSRSAGGRRRRVGWPAAWAALARLPLVPDSPAVQPLSPGGLVACMRPSISFSV